MGAEQSTITQGRGSQAERKGFHILRVDPNSPAEKAELIPFFDYITSVNGVEITQESPNVVAEMAKNHIERPMKMTIYNSRLDADRVVSLTPSRAWGGKSLMGARIRFASVTDAPDRVWHIINVIKNSPADTAGLIPNKDWIIGSPEISLNSPDDFYNLMIHNQRRPVRLLVFNIDDEVVRETSVIPDFNWEGEGCLGCDVGSGVLHRIPSKVVSSVGAPVSLEEPTAEMTPPTLMEEQELVASPINNTNPPPSNPIPTSLTTTDPSLPPQPEQQEIKSENSHNSQQSGKQEFSMAPIPGFGNSRVADADDDDPFSLS